MLSAASWSQNVSVITADGKTVTLSGAQIAAAPHVTVEVRDHEALAKFEGISMSALLPLAGVQLGASLHGPRMAEALLVEAVDGYKVVFALTEFDPEFSQRQIILADKRDGKPLQAKEGPLRIVAPGDKRPARWVRQVMTLRVVTVK